MTATRYNLTDVGCYLDSTFGRQRIRWELAEMIRGLPGADADLMSSLRGPLEEAPDDLSDEDDALEILQAVTDDASWEFRDGDLMLVGRPTLYLDDLDAAEGLVEIHVQCPGAAAWAKDEQTIAGARWECCGGDFAYAIVANDPDLVEELESDGYELNLDNYSGPDDTEGK